MEKKARANRMSLLARCLEYRGSDEHIAFKAGDNKKAQLGVGDKGIVNTSEKYTIAHSNHIALKWADLKGPRRIEKTPGESTLVTRPQRIGTTAAMRNDTLIVIEADHLVLHRQLLIISDIRPKFTF